MHILKIRKMNPDAKLPEYAHPGDAGLDLFSVDRAEILPREIKLIQTGIAIELPENTEAQIRSRSGLALKHGIAVLNAPGTIDHGYRGQIGVILINHGKEKFMIEPGMKIAQMVIAPVLSVEVVEDKNLSETQRSSGGFGSTGN